METVKKQNIKHYILLYFAAVYLFVGIAHIFYLPHYNVDNTTKATGNSIFKRHFSDNQQGPVEIKRTDKSTIEEQKNIAADIIAVASVAFVLISALFGLVKLVPRSTFAAAETPVYNRQYAYLQLCTFRI